MVVTQQHLVSEQSRQQLGLVVGEAAVPHFAVQLKQGLEPFVEWFHRLTAAAENLATLAAGQELPALAATQAGLVRGGSSLAAFLAAAPVFRAQETTAAALALVVPLDRFAVVIVVITAVCRDIDSALG